MKLPWPTFVMLIGALAVCGCAAQLAGRLTLPDRYTVVRQQLTIHSDFPLPEHHRLLDELGAQRADLSRRLGLPDCDEPLHVYLFESAERFHGFMRLHHPQFPRRRAFFVETDTRLSVYAQWGDHVGEDLRHEAAHGYLHSVVQNLPLWLDEGLAKYCEAPRGLRGLNRGYVGRLTQRLQQKGWQPDLHRLERIEPSRDMDEDQYAESWAWVHFLLESRPEYNELLRGYLADLRRDGSTEPVSLRLERMLHQPQGALIEHVRALLESANR